jgi:hypothetical protein
MTGIREELHKLGLVSTTILGVYSVWTAIWLVQWIMFVVS